MTGIFREFRGNFGTFTVFFLLGEDMVFMVYSHLDEVIDMDMGILIGIQIYIYNSISNEMLFGHDG